MNQPYLFPVPPNDIERPTDYFVLPPAQIYEEPKSEITVGKALFHLLLLGITAVTTTFYGALLLGGLFSGMLFSFTVLMILGAHELGHYFACRYYGVRATLPYFIPSPLPIGTFGAVIKIKERIPSKKALFDIGIAGPLAGFVFVIPAALIGLYFAQAAGTFPATGESPIFHDPPLFLALAKLLGLPHDILTNPIWFAAWFGCLITSLNLLPVGQLDGGHVVYAVFGRRLHWLIARVIYVSVIALAIASYFYNGWMGWVVYIIILTIMVRAGHPPVSDEEEPLDLARKIVALIGLVVFLLCFMPVPISM